MRGYYMQVWKISAIIFFCVCVLMTILVMPTIILLQTEVKIKVDKIASLKKDIAIAESKDFEGEVANIQNKITILKGVPRTDVRNVYTDIKEIIEHVDGVEITAISVDSLTSSIHLITKVRDKEVAKNLVDTLQKTQYTGAVLSYAVLSEKGSFIFEQHLSYE